MLIQRHAGYILGSLEKLGQGQLDELVSLFSQTGGTSNDSLLGRRLPIRKEIAGLGGVVVKHYYRGGMLRFLNSDTYLRLNTHTRGELEFLMLEKVRSLGIAAPKPIAFGYSPGLFYKAWLVSHEIVGGVPLSVLVYQDEERIHDIFPKITAEVDKLIRNKIFHVDLHPGNVLITPDNQVHLLDFDKAVDSISPVKKIRDGYLCRWRRAVIKHRLPEVLVELFSLGLRAHYVV